MGNFFRTLLNYLWRGWFVLLGLVATLLCAPFAYLFSFRPKDYRRGYFFMRLWCLILFYGMGFSYELIHKKGMHLKRDRQYVIISNHTSVMDIMLMCILHPHHPISFVGKKELVKIPIFGSIYKRVAVMVDRNSIRSRANVYQRCARRMEEGQNISIFPEGGVPDDVSVVLDNFKDGAFVLASGHDFPLAVYTFLGLKEMFPFNYREGHPGRVKVILNDIIEPGKSKEDLKIIAFKLIYQSIIEKK